MISPLRFCHRQWFSTLSVEIYSLARRGISLNINALSALLFLFTTLLVVIYYFITQRNKVNGMGFENDEQACSFFLMIAIASAVLLYAISSLNTSQGYSGANTLTIYNWGDYIDEDLIKQFEKETGIKVIYETFDSNEAMLTKIEQGGTTYDIAIPSEYMIDKMRHEDLLIPLDHSKLPNLKILINDLWTFHLIRKISIPFRIFGEPSASSIIQKCFMVKKLPAGMTFGILH